MPTWLREALCAQGSTRQLGLLRIALAWLLWASWGYPFILHFDLHGDRVLLAFGFYASAWVLVLGVGSRLASFGTSVFLIIAIWSFGETTAATIWSQQHRVLVALFALVFSVTPSGRSLSLERWIELRRATRLGRSASPECGPLWGLVLVRVLGGTILATTSVSLLSQDWLSGRLVAETFLRGGETTRDATPNSIDVGIAVGVAVTHAFVAIGAWLRRVRGVAVLVGMGLYLGLFAVTRMDTTGLLMCWVLFAFVAPEAIDRALALLHGDSKSAEHFARDVEGPSSSR